MEVGCERLRRDASQCLSHFSQFVKREQFCKERQLAVEIDGAFHFADAEHCRRDRRKDFLLQKNGYLVLRFLAEDVTRHLAQVIDEIAAALAIKRE